MQKYAYGFPRLGKNREFKKLIEGYWDSKFSLKEMENGIYELEKERLSVYKKYVDKFPVGEMTFYDNMLDTAIMIGLYKANNIDEYFKLCRGKDALELTKWFDTNYHYLVPDLSLTTPKFSLGWNKPKQAKEKHQKGIPYMIGPFTFLKLSKGLNYRNFKDYLMEIGKVYKEVIENFDEVHIDEPAFVMDLSEEEIQAIKDVYSIIANEDTKINLFTYYESVDFLKDLYKLPVEAIGLDFVHGKENLENIKRLGFPEDKTLIAGLVDGRNVWKTNIKNAVETLKELSRYAKNLAVSNAAPLYHLPITVEGEKLDQRLLDRLSFAEERLYELGLIDKAYEGKEVPEWNKETEFGINETVRERIRNLTEKDFVKPVAYPERVKKQKKILKLPLFPMTTIGSFPQTLEVRKKRADYRTGRISEHEYKEFIKNEIKKAIELQEEMGLDVLVHGEFERTDMVEFFAGKLDGIATTKKGWIISYGTRGYRPPIIWGDVSRPCPMTIEEIAYAQSLTKRPVKGMLTGAVTIIAWSFLREDRPVNEVAYQISLCLQDEIKDYENAGIKIVQIDEAAFREKAPIKKRNWDKYFDWAVKSFKLASQSKPETQIHSHMCYSEFGEIIDKIAQMDFDVISIEASRSKGDIIDAFEKVHMDRQIGLGVYDIHSPAIPTVEDIRKIIRRALRVIPKESFWINPDCGLKTRKWEEIIPSLKNIVYVVKELRSK